MSVTAARTAPLIAIACGGTGGHLYPGLAVGAELARHGCRVQLIVSPKEVDQRAVAAIQGMEVVTLPAVGLVGRRYAAFAVGFLRSLRLAWRQFRKDRPAAVLAMGGFTAAPPVVAGKLRGARVFLHESNSIPGRANRWLAGWADQVFIWFTQSARRLRNRNLLATGMPVRAGFAPATHSAAGEAATLLIMGGSQGAHGVNTLMIDALEVLKRELPNLRFVHLTGPQDQDLVRQAYARHGLAAEVHSHSDEMPRLMRGATLAIARAGASSLAELAAVRLPSILIPYPHAADNHQFFNAGAFEGTGAARMVDQRTISGEGLAEQILQLLGNPGTLDRMSQALAEWHHPMAARRIAECVLAAVGHTSGGTPAVPELPVVEASPRAPERVEAAALSQV